MKYFTIFFLLYTTSVFSQVNSSSEKELLIDDLLDSLWVNPTSFFNSNETNWRLLCSNLHQVDRKKLNQVRVSIYAGNQAMVENESTSSEGILGSLNSNSHKKKLKKFRKKIEGDFTNKDLFPNNKIVLVEGDSWLEYPLFLHDITDNLMEQDNLAVYSIASGGDWAANMISGGEYLSDYLKFKPNVFIISGGGNDLLDEERLLNLISKEPIDEDAPFLKDYREYVVLRQNNKPVPMCNASYCPIEYHTFQDSLATFTSNIDGKNLEKIVNGRRYINKNFYRFLVTFKLEYKILFESLRKIDSVHFDSLKIITQGHDYAIPNSGKKFGVRLLLENGKWLKKPFENEGITDQYTQESIVMALIFDFNEMLIELGKEYHNISHVDVRGFTSFLEQYNHKKTGTYWYNELHPSNPVFAEISKTYVAIINNNISKERRVVSVIQYFKEHEE